ncbi:MULTISPECIES: hypothetical protein [Kordiimonas]|uniref:hypothetical protein n=1 Tax=Kordiimonas TaxID=288021 RepID=UPI002579CEF6|nr:hypothetical protein [Kordiimonas sp. UBA4487]
MKQPNRNISLVMFAGALMTIIGAFSPLLDVIHLKVISYADIGKPQLYVLIACAVLAPVLDAVKSRKGAFVAVLGVWGALCWPLIRWQLHLEREHGFWGEVEKHVTDPLEEAGEHIAERLFLRIDDFEWGGYVFLGGVVLMTIAALMGLRKAK